MSRSRSYAAVGMVVGLTLAWGAGREAATETRRDSPFRLISEQAIPESQSSWTDIRWASDDSVYLVSAYHGVREVALDGQLTKRRRPVPGKATLEQFQEFGRLAVSADHLVVAGYDHNLAWRPADPGGTGLVLFQHRAIATAQDIDLRGDSLLLLGTPDMHSPQPGLIWKGSLSADLNDFRPLLPEDFTPLWRCSPLSLGAARFLADGSLLAIPGIRPGGHIFDRNNRLVRTLSSEEIGIDTDCRGVSRELAHQLSSDPAAYDAWMSRHRVLEAILPLPEGPGVIVRSVGGDGKVRWDLRILPYNGQPARVPSSDRRASYQRPPLRRPAPGPARPLASAGLLPGARVQGRSRRGACP
jgi:hypothetical protein